ncbi:helix-turn-helix domain-containing protein [Pseudactinotalea sp. HY160]|uniref:IclR family transcriptional regulator n=1 Tax=Pseudactinotalea sp. HY160 TaxID=2654490 RepID=UPI00128C6681|nr:IclR family transcriptional regulator C-terminal domain-containing protein [Pseudactinotalea sp. HY160]MPV51368.1 helix-turn-helix domain-containing protein [Pseudactinotalea sp. HY160]
MTKPTLIHSVVRALSLLDAVGTSAVPLTAKQLARRTTVPLSTTYHLLCTLVHEGYLACFQGGYVLGSEVYALRSPTGIDARRAREALTDLHNDSGAAAYLAALRGEEIWIVDIIDDPTTPRVDLWVGLHEAAHATALGKAILRAMAPAQRSEYLGRHRLADLTPHTITNPRRLLNELTDAEFAVDNQEYAVDTSCLALPVPSTSWTAAVAISLPATRAGDLGRHAVGMRRAATRIALDTAA